MSAHRNNEHSHKLSKCPTSQSPPLIVETGNRTLLVNTARLLRTFLWPYPQSIRSRPRSHRIWSSDLLESRDVSSSSSHAPHSHNRNCCAWTLLGLRESSVVSSLCGTSDPRKLCMLRTQGSVPALLEPYHFLDPSVSTYKVVQGKRMGLKKSILCYF